MTFIIGTFESNQVKWKKITQDMCKSDSRDMCKSDNRDIILISETKIDS